MTEFELVKAVIKLNNFNPPEGVSYAVHLWPLPGVCRVGVSLGVPGDRQSERTFTLVTPPTNEQLRLLYLEAQNILDTSLARTARTETLFDYGQIGEG